MQTLKLDNGSFIEPKDDDIVFCEEHNISVRWGDLSPIQQLAVEEGIDVEKQLKCILLPKSKDGAA